jgi:glyoxylate reductase
MMARRAHGFDMNVLYYNRQRLPEAEEAVGRLTYVPLNELLQQSDFISIHVPYTPETHHFIGAPEFEQMKANAILINTARGPIVDERALALALRKGKIAGAGLDVFEREPEVDPDLLKLEQVVLVPHIGSASVQTRTRMALMASENIIAHIEGKRPPNLLNTEIMTQ